MFFSKDLKGKKEKDTVEFFTRELKVRGDVKIEFFHAATTQRMFSLAFNIALETSDSRGKLSFKKMDLDRACQDTLHTNFKQNFTLEVFLLSEEVNQEMRRGSFSSPSISDSSLLGNGGIIPHLTRYDSKKPLSVMVTTPTSSLSSMPPSTLNATLTPSSPSGRRKIVPKSDTSNLMSKSSPTSSPFSSLTRQQTQATSPNLASSPSGVSANLSSSTSPAKQRPNSMALFSALTKRESIIPKLPPLPVASARRHYFSYQRSETQQAPSNPILTAAPSNPTLSNAHAPTTPPPTGLCAICSQTLSLGVTIEIFLDTTIHIECMKCGTCGRSLEAENNQCILKEGKITCLSCSKRY